MTVLLKCSGGKCREFVGIWFTFPGKNGENGGGINIIEGKVPKKTGKLVHFPGKQRQKNHNFASMLIGAVS